jgi:hypothetical protein
MSLNGEKSRRSQKTAPAPRSKNLRLVRLMQPTLQPGEERVAVEVASRVPVEVAAVDLTVGAEADEVDHLPQRMASDIRKVRKFKTITGMGRFRSQRKIHPFG